MHCVEIQRTVPQDAQALIWSEFFGSRGRGRSLTTHSPWIEDRAGLICLTARSAEGGDLKGTLVVKFSRNSYGDAFGMIGYVCVDPAFRRLGVSKALVEKAVAAAYDEGCAGCLLWTQTPEVYVGNGFVQNDRDIFRQYDRVAPSASETDFLAKAWPVCENKARGFPAYATSAQRMEAKDASLILLTTNVGPSVAEWQGSEAAVLDLVAAVTSGPWWLNALAGDALLADLARKGVPMLAERPSGLMVRLEQDKASVSLPEIRLLDRI